MSASTEPSRSPFVPVLVGLSALVSLVLTVPTLYRYVDDALAGPPYPVSDPLDPDLAARIPPRLAEIEDELGQEPALTRVDIDQQELFVYVQVPDEPDAVDSYRWRHEGHDIGTNPQPSSYESPANLFGPSDVDPEVVAQALTDAADHHPDSPDTSLVPTRVKITADEARIGEPRPVIVITAEDDDSHSDERWEVVFGPDGTHLRTEQTR